MTPVDDGKRETRSKGDVDVDVVVCNGKFVKAVGRMSQAALTLG